MELKNHVIQIGEYSISYWDTCNTLANNVIILLAPGACTGEVFSHALRTFQNEDIRCIAPDYPGRGGSRYFSPGLNALDNCAYCILALIDTLKIDSFTVLAVSFGTMVADYLLRKDNGICKGCILIAAGEYFTGIQRSVLKTLFIPTQLTTLQFIYRKTLSPVMRGLSHTEPGTLRQQWIETLTYNVNSKNPHNTPCILINCKSDHIVN